MIKTEITICNKLGLHARATAKLVKLASSFESNIELEKDTQRVNAKSIMGVMMLAASKGTVLNLYVEGKDEAKATEAVVHLVKEGFEELA